ncbi:lipopolysaccharide kinase InaA family protein [Autumnicola musiva]|uniref:Lipopolysaccharide kinase InaA family protein n=1 Tax=Autumnicola musiva TaxID=3075589 RepID=A0ABU3D3B3_9FLAO|nr:lipopolysaccharide kinase InaA family protein [Zunongwangia sp. F117]MDT0675984.1 lipopolysaccharide kinase InaA family protein [Zunongwangia sp. F117]
MKLVLSEYCHESKSHIEALISNFHKEGEILSAGKRNSIKIFDLKGKKINIKSFKIPNLINTITYRFFRKSKAERSFVYAETLLSKGIGTPSPIAFAENTSAFAFRDSYYISEHLDYDLTYRELVTNPEYPDNEQILRAFTRFTHKLHEEGVEFLDHSPGNTLIQLENGNYKFFLVDLNRMNFRKLNFEKRMKNFSRLTPKKNMVEVMADEYAKLIDRPKEEVFEKMWFFTHQFQKRYRRKHEFKKKLKL